MRRLTFLEQWMPAIKRWANMSNLEPSLLAALVWQESSGRERAYRFEPGFWRRYLAGKVRWAPSSGSSPEEVAHHIRRVSASYGLCQIMYPVACENGYVGEPEGLFDPDTNLKLGARILAAHINRAGGRTAGGLLRYNGGGRPAYADEVLRKKARVEELQ